jgi:hypothetical protein
MDLRSFSREIPAFLRAADSSRKPEFHPNDKIATEGTLLHGRGRTELSVPASNRYQLNFHHVSFFRVILRNGRYILVFFLNGGSDFSGIFHVDSDPRFHHLAGKKRISRDVCGREFQNPLALALFGIKMPYSCLVPRATPGRLAEATGLVADRERKR